MAINLPIIKRDRAFQSDPLFNDCWNFKEKEKPILSRTNSEQQKFRKASFDGQADGSHNVTIPWKWNKMGMIKEFFTPGRLPLMERSEEVDTYKWFYQVLLDVQEFAPEDLSITLTDRTVTIKGKHGEKEDGIGVGVSRSFTRKFIIPADIKMDNIECHLSSDGVLHITAPRIFVDFDPKEEEEDITTKYSVQDYFNALSAGGGSPRNDDRNSGSSTSVGQHRAANSRRLSMPDTNYRHQLYNSRHSIHTLPDFDMVPFWARDKQAILKSPFGIKSDKSNFMVVVDVGEFAPEDLRVSTTRHYVLVEGGHGEKSDQHGLITRDFCRKYWMPSNANGEEAKCHLNQASGVLVIIVPKSKQNMAAKANDVPVVLAILTNELDWE